MTWLYQWANPSRLHSMAHPDELAAAGYEIIGADPRYPETVLMRREVPADE